MKFEVIRTSIGLSLDSPNKQPCPEAKSLWVPPPEGSTQQPGRNLWSIEIETLEDLLELSKKQDEPLVITHRDDEMPKLEIYDDYHA